MVELLASPIELNISKNTIICWLKMVKMSTIKQKLKVFWCELKVAFLQTIQMW